MRQWRLELQSREKETSGCLGEPGTGVRVHRTAGGEQTRVRIQGAGDRLKQHSNLQKKGLCIDWVMQRL